MGYEVLKRAVDAVLEAGLNALRDLQPESQSQA